MPVYRSRERDGVVFDAGVPKSLVHTHLGVFLVLRPAQVPGSDFLSDAPFFGIYKNPKKDKKKKRKH